MFTPNDFFNMLGTAYLLAFVAICALVVWLVRSVRWRLATLAAVGIAFAYPMVTSYLENKERQERSRLIGERFQKLCKEKAGYKIVRTVEGAMGSCSCGRVSRPIASTSTGKYGLAGRLFSCLGF